MEAYVDAFQEGFKCVEIDCWDGENGPIVTHGHTLTSKLTFHDVIQVVKQYAFIISDHPVVLSLEVHCGFNQQGLMADILLDVLGDLLYTITDYHQKSFPTLA